MLGTSLDLQLVGTSNLEEVERQVLDEIERLDLIFSRYLADSEFSRWQETRGEPIPMTPELAFVLDLAEQWRIKTDGAFNPTAISGTPSFSKLWEAAVSPAVGTRLTDQPASLDAIAKGFIIDRCAEIASSVTGVNEVVVNIGGDIRHAGRQALAIDIADPIHSSENAPAIDRVHIKNAGLATSGSYRRGLHIVDPRTGIPTEHVLSVSVIAQNATTADILSTAISVLNPNESLKLVASMEDVAFLLVLSSGERIESQRWYSFRFKR